ncbi:MAG: bifunctional (p)ppGpp synthetase/guanosine-3',5'-bis(diphosphate) 3'-pyrophosphohydrolase [Armatimonadota bacterium]|nr:bifunctional (p)ppGpp synthetase/guanosine-3',5'-bis(diphosphate) 3'-pyrophosphohydrolase [Armatimonadota bacterium]
MANTHPDNLQGILSRVEGYWSEEDMARLESACRFAREAHADSPPRKTGHPFITHPLAVAEILSEIEADPTTVIAGLLHDTVEDTHTDLEEIEAQFGETISKLVDGVTKLTRLDFHTRQEQQAENLRKMFLAMAQDIRVILIKFADRLHNMRTLFALPQEKQRGTATETLHIFAPLAHRLGIWRFKWELEDLSFRYVEPEVYYEVAQLLGQGRAEREQKIEAVRTAVQGRLQAEGVTATVHGRAKHIYSIAQKMQSQDVSFDQIADLAAIRIITGSVADCYAALGLVHELWMPIQGMFTDYIAKPKANKYQSLHTKVIGPDKQPLEVQIRTWEMHRVAEYGVAAHWRYKEGRRGTPSDDQISLLRQVLELETDLTESHEFLELLQTDLFNDQVFVFTPDGDVIDLPAGAGPIDFAYRIHTEIGHHCVGARVNGRQVSLSYQFRNGDIAEILTSASAEPSRDWLELIKSSRAKAKVRRHLRAKVHAENVEAGTNALREALSEYPRAVQEAVDLEDLSDVLGNFGFKDTDDLLAAVGYGDVEADTVIRDLVADEVRPESLAEEVEQVLAESGSGGPSPRGEAPAVSVDGMDGFQCRLSKCCSPLPGDDITGYITRGKGLTIHRSDCKNLRYHAENEPDRVVPLNWSRNGDGAIFQHEIEIVAVDRVGLFSHIAAVIAECGINIASANANTTDSGVARLHLSLDIRRRQDLDHVLERLRSLIDVISVRHMSLSR